MEKHGVTFKDYALAGANLANGMSLDKVCEVLGIEEPIWQEVQEFYINNMAAMSHEDLAFYSSVFTNPKQGKFENVEGAAGGVEDVLAKYPEWSDLFKMQAYSSEASDVGLEIDFDKEFGISVMQFSQLAGHWSAWFKEKVLDVQRDLDTESPEYAETIRITRLHGELEDKWSAYYKEKFKDMSADISDDIDF